MKTAQTTQLGTTASVNALPGRTLELSYNYWRRVAEDDRISQDFRALASRNRDRQCRGSGR